MSIIDTQSLILAAGFIAALLLVGKAAQFVFFVLADLRIVVAGIAVAVAVVLVRLRKAEQLASTDGAVDKAPGNARRRS